MYWEMAGGETLNMYNGLDNIDFMARNYNYTHEQAFSLSWSEIMTIIVMCRRRGVVEYRYQALRQKADERNSR